MSTKNSRPLNLKNFKRPIIIVTASLVSILLFTALIIWLVINPTRPTFTIQDAVVYTFNTTNNSSLTTTIRVSLLSRNPNAHAGIFYDQLDIYAAYRNQPITPSASMAKSYQGHTEATIWSPLLFATGVPISPEIVFAIAMDESAGNLVINVRAEGRMRFKVGSWIGGQLRIIVSCSAYFQLGVGVYDIVSKLEIPIPCNVEI